MIFSNMTNTVTEHQSLKQGLMTEKIDLNAMAQKYKSGLYYMMCIVDQKFRKIEEKVIAKEKKKKVSKKISTMNASKQRNKGADMITQLYNNR